LRPHEFYNRFIAPLLAVLALACLGSSSAIARDVVHATFLSSPDSAPSVLADFDGDQKLDLATLGPDKADESPLIAVEFGTTKSPVFTFLIRGAGNRLRARDLDGDNDRDLVLETAFRVPLAVWINDGAGNFQQGNLESFRFQLSHDDPASIGSADAFGFPLRGGECSRRNALVSDTSVCGPQLARATLLAKPFAPLLVSNHHDIWTRGPPCTR